MKMIKCCLREIKYFFPVLSRKGWEVAAENHGCEPLLEGEVEEARSDHLTVIIFQSRTVKCNLHVIL